MKHHQIFDDWEKVWFQLVRRGAVGPFYRYRQRPTFFIEGPVLCFEELNTVERNLGFSIPAPLREFFLEYSQEIDISWQFPSESPVSFPNWGYCQLGLSQTLYLYGVYQNWLATCFNDLDNEYDLVWQNKFPIQEVGNGDLIALELNETDFGSILYLSHDDSYRNGWMMGTDLVSFLEIWGKLGFPGPEYWENEQFMNSSNMCLDLSSPNAKTWLEWLGESS
ncbi:MAG: SMI1/KNR4 family protein [Blastocatellia bacterium]|nr:SMI1/KNR4 family protein [Blastocatellia bacterium]